MALPSPSPSPFPYSHSPIYPANKRASMPDAQRLAWGSRAVRPPSFGRGPPKNTYGGPFHTPRPKYIRRATLPSLSHNPTHPQEPKTKLWATDHKGAHMGGFLHPPFWAHGQVTPNPKKLGGVQFWEPPILGPSGSLALFCTFGLLSISRPPGPPTHLPIPNLSPANPPILGQT